MGLEIRWLPRAVRSRDDQLDYVAERNPQVAIDLGDRMRSAVRGLAEHPRRGRAGRQHRTRKPVVTGTPYLIVYRLEGRTLVILRVLHGAQQ